MCVGEDGPRVVWKSSWALLAASWFVLCVFLPSKSGVWGFSWEKPSFLPRTVNSLTLATCGYNQQMAASAQRSPSGRRQLQHLGMEGTQEGSKLPLLAGELAGSEDLPVSMFLPLSPPNTLSYACSQRGSRGCQHGYDCSTHAHTHMIPRLRPNELPNLKVPFFLYLLLYILALTATVLLKYVFQWWHFLDSKVNQVTRQTEVVSRRTH